MAGTLVYFFLMSITPFIFWLSLVFGKVNMSFLLQNELVRSVSPFLRYLKSTAESAVSGAGIILLVTSLYSSTNFFYHLRRSGEIIYDTARVKGGIKLRIASALLIVICLVLFAAVGSLTVLGTNFLNRFLPHAVSEILVAVFFVALAFLVCVILNVFACPFRLKFKDAVPGSLLTVGLWIVFLVGFAVYTTFATPERLYGKIASVIVFLLWCYLMMNGFVIGMIDNGRFYKPKQRLEHKKDIL